MSGPCFVYFVQAGSAGNIKIGISRNVARRLVKMQTDAPEKLSVLLVIAGNEIIERNLHAEISTHRISGEWFSPHADVLSLIERERGKSGNVEYMVPRPARMRAPKCPLEAWRRANGLTQLEVAELFDTSQATLSTLENGCTPSWELMETIYRATDGAVTPNDFAAFMRQSKVVAA